MNELAADDIYYTQLTLPLPSFDALKKANGTEVEIETPLNKKVSAWVVVEEPSVEEYTEFKKEEQEAWNDFFLYFSKHFREWWD